MNRLAERIRQGLLHRLLCGGFFVVLLPLFANLGWAEGGLAAFLPVVACLVGAVLGFAAPLILTQGWNRPIAASAHLALIGRRGQLLMALAIWLLLFGPSVARGIGRLMR